MTSLPFHYIFLIKIYLNFIIDKSEFHENRKLNGPPIFKSELQALNITLWKSTSYLLPSVIDPDADNYIISAKLYNGSDLPNWIIFDSRKIAILIPKGVSIGKSMA